MRILEQTDKQTMVCLPTRRWKHLMELEHAYKVACSMLKARKQCDAMPSMPVSEAFGMIDKL